MSTTATLDQAKHMLTLISQKGLPKDQLTALFEGGLLSDLLDADVGQVDREAFRNLLGLKSLKKPKLALLEPIGTIAIPATTTKFVAKNKFVRDTSRQAKVKISHQGYNFTSWFLNGDGKTEDPISEQALRYAKLCKASTDGPIIAELGGEEKSETTLSEMFALMEKQGNGEDGVLLTNGYWNIFYIKDANNVLRLVSVRWGGGGWRVYADSVENPNGWVAGNQVFSRNCN